MVEHILRAIRETEQVAESLYKKGGHIPRPPENSPIEFFEADHKGENLEGSEPAEIRFRGQMKNHPTVRSVAIHTTPGGSKKIAISLRVFGSKKIRITPTIRNSLRTAGYTLDKAKIRASLGRKLDLKHSGRIIGAFELVSDRPNQLKQLQIIDEGHTEQLVRLIFGQGQKPRRPAHLRLLPGGKK